MADLSVTELADALRAAGLHEGEALIVHSSLRSLGRVAGGATAVVAALLEVIGQRGSLMLPTFNYSWPLPEPWYDPQTTPGRTGAVPEAGRRWPTAIRSLHPTHSVAVIGPQAKAWTRDHLEGRAFGVGSPIDRLLSAGGRIVLLGVGHTSNSALHVAEEHAALPKPDRGPQPVVKIHGDTGVITHQLDSSPSCSAGFGAAEAPLRQAGAVHDARVGGALTQIVDGQRLLAAMHELLRQRPDALLCNWAGCASCSNTRRALGLGG